MVGRGASARVHQVQLQKTNEIVAVKSFDASHFVVAHNELDVYRELCAIQNPFVAKFINTEEDAEHVHIVMQFCEGGDLFRRFERLREEMVEISEHVIFYMAELVHALDVMHTNCIVLNDLKTENVGIDADGHVCLIDFGLSSLHVTSDRQLHLLNGSSHSMPPEKAMHQGYGLPADMFALGCLLYEICTGCRPSAYYDSKTGGSELDPAVLRNVQDPYCDAMKVLTQHDPSARPSASEFKSHPLFYGVDWVKVAEKQVKPPWVPVVSDDHVLDPDAFDLQYVHKPDLGWFSAASSSV